MLVTFQRLHFSSSLLLIKGKKGKGWVLARELVTRSALQSRKWQLIGMS